MSLWGLRLPRKQARGSPEAGQGRAKTAKGACGGMQREAKAYISFGCEIKQTCLRIFIVCYRKSASYSKVFIGIVLWLDTFDVK